MNEKAMLESEEFNAIWQVIKTWDINVPEVKEGRVERKENL